MSGETIDVTTPDGVADAYVARPDGDGRHPGVLLVMDAFGLRPAIERMADRIAARGYLVLAPNVFYRDARTPVVPQELIGDGDRRSELLGKVRPLIGSLTPDVVARDADAYLGWLEREGRGPVAITGYCMGGRFGWYAAAAYPDRVAALGAFHTGGLVTDGPDSPHLRAGDLRAELYLGFADSDASATPEQVATVDEALDAAGVRHTTEVYTGALHGYTMADTPVYDEAAAERHFDELFALLERTIGSGAAVA
ncbi:MAG TPA: dienelactone hydrolase family protein [Solirubrobacteraceae bacterium]|nr:dienelactone hydrolase family protein [Solirubrobacteraceae bacterium]